MTTLLRRFALSLALGSLAAGTLALGPLAHGAPNDWRPAWLAVPDSPGRALKAVTIRQVVRTSVGGHAVRIRLSNLYGKAPLTIASVRMARPAGGARIAAGTDLPLTFSGKLAVTIPAGASVVSDPVDLAVPALAELALSFYLPDGAAVPTLHGVGMQTAFLAPGDATAAPDLPGAQTDDSRYFLTGLEVVPDGPVDTLVVLGDSIADGVGSNLDRNGRWPDLLAARLQGASASASASATVSVLDAGIAGNRLLNDASDPYVGPSGLARFGRDALDQPGVRWVLLHEGINDITAARQLHGPADKVGSAQIIAGMKTLAARARAQGVNIWIGTLMPFEGTEGFYSEAAEAERQAVNAWIRTSATGAGFDAVIDFDGLMRDAAHPSRLRADYDSGDHLHPNADGYRAMADAVDLQRLRRP